MTLACRRASSLARRPSFSRPTPRGFLFALARLPTHEWVRAARAYATARHSLMFAEARASLLAVLTAAREEPTNAAVAAEIIRRIAEAVRAVRPAVGDRVALRAMRQSATAAALAWAFRERLTPAEVSLLTAPCRSPPARLQGKR